MANYIMAISKSILLGFEECDTLLISCHSTTNNIKEIQNSPGIYPSLVPIQFFSALV